MKGDATGSGRQWRLTSLDAGCAFVSQPQQLWRNSLLQRVLACLRNDRRGRHCLSSTDQSQPRHSDQSADCERMI